MLENEVKLESVCIEIAPVNRILEDHQIWAIRYDFI